MKTVKEFKYLSAAPVRNGHIYCSPFCGGGCTWAEFQRVTKAAEQLAKRMGKGWKPSVHENLGWHFQVVSPCGRIKVSPNYANWTHGKIYNYCAFLGETETPGGRWYVNEKTPELAVKNVIKKAKAEVKEFSDLISGL